MVKAINLIETDEQIKRRKKNIAIANISETDEQIKRRKKSMGSKNHSILQYNLILQLGFKYHKTFQFIPELSIDIDGFEKIPDLAIYKDLEITPEADEIRVKKLPLGVVEILSPTQSLTELIVKSHTYFDGGISSYWLVIPTLKSIYVYSAKGEHKVYTNENILKDTVLNIELDLSKVFK